MRKNPRLIPIRESLTTRVLIGGCEKVPLFLVFVLTTLPIAVAFLVDAFSIKLFIISLTIGVLGFISAKYLSRNDPYMFAIIWRHIGYKALYLAHEGYPGKKYYKFLSPIRNIETKSLIK